MESLEGLREITEIDISQILNSLIDSTRDIELKTEILKPKQLAALKILADYISSFNLNNSSEIIHFFLNVYFRYMVSYNRKSRTEIIRAISYQMEIQNKTSLEKMAQKIP